MKAPKTGDYIRITIRKCGKQQPAVKVGDVYLVKSVEALKNGAVVCVCDDGKKDRRINSDRFSWQVFTEKEVQVYVAKGIDEARTRKMMDSLSNEEKQKLAVIPLIFVEIAWKYAAQVLRIAAAERVSELKQACRTVRQLRTDYVYTYRNNLDFESKRHLDNWVQRFTSENAYNFQILYWSINGYFKKIYPVNDRQEMRTYAIISMLFIRMAYAYSEKYGELARQRTGVRQYGKLDATRNALYTMMKAFAGIDEAFDFGSKEVTDNVKVIINKMEATDKSEIKICV